MFVLSASVVNRDKFEPDIDVDGDGESVSIVRVALRTNGITIAQMMAANTRIAITVDRTRRCFRVQVGSRRL